MDFPANFCASASSSNLTQEYWALEEEQITHGLVIAVYLFFCELLGLPWNILVLVTIVKEKLWHQPNIILLVNLIVADLFILLFPTPLLMITGFAGEFILGSSDEIRCQSCALNILQFVAYMNSIVTVAMMSLDRFFYIYTPLKYELSSTKYIAGAAVVTSIVVSTALGLFIKLPSTTQYFKPLMMCVSLFNPSLLVPCLLMVIFAGTLVVIAISNGCFSWIVLRNIRAVYSLNNSFDVSSKEEQLCNLKKRVTSTRHQKQKRLCCMQLALILASLLTLVPETFIVWTSHFQIHVITVLYIMFYSQVYIHPIIETYLISDIRIALRDMLTCGYFKRKLKDGLNDHKISKGWKGGKCSFFITAFQAAIIPKEQSFQ